MNESPFDVIALRRDLKWTQQQLADYCDVDRSTVSKWETDGLVKGPALVLLRLLRDGKPTFSAPSFSAEAVQ